LALASPCCLGGCCGDSGACAPPRTCSRRTAACHSWTGCPDRDGGQTVRRSTAAGRAGFVAAFELVTARGLARATTSRCCPPATAPSPGAGATFARRRGRSRCRCTTRDRVPCSIAQCASSPSGHAPGWRCSICTMPSAHTPRRHAFSTPFAPPAFAWPPSTRFAGTRSIAPTTGHTSAASLAYNAEVALMVQDPALGAAMDSIFLADLRHSEEIRLPAFQRRSRWMRIRERGARALAGLL
jgi:hypothetical protein